MHLLLRHADRGDLRRRDVRGNHLRELHLRERRRALRVRRHRGIHRRRHRDDRPVRRRDGRAVRRGRAPGVPNATAWHPGSGEEAWSRGWGEVRPGREPDGVHPDLQPDEVHPGPEPGEVRPDLQLDEVHPGREPDGYRHPGAEHREPDGVPVVPPERTSTGCFRHEAPSVPAWDREPLASGLPVLWDVLHPESLPMRRELPEQRAQPELEPPDVRAQDVPVSASGAMLRASAPVWMPPVLLEQPGPLLRVLPESDAEPAWGRAAVHRAWRPCSASVHPRCGRCLRGRPTSRTGTTHGYDALRALRLWTMLI